MSRGMSERHDRRFVPIRLPKQGLNRSNSGRRNFGQRKETNPTPCESFSMTTASGPYAPPGGMPPADVASKAGNMQLMGILSIVFGACCCQLVGLILGIIVLVQAPNVL